MVIARLLLLPKASEAAPAEDWGGLGGWVTVLGGEGGRAKAVEEVEPGAGGMLLLLLDISPVAVSAWQEQEFCITVKGFLRKSRRASA